MSLKGTVEQDYWIVRKFNLFSYSVLRPIVQKVSRSCGTLEIMQFVRATRVYGERNRVNICDPLFLNVFHSVRKYCIIYFFERQNISTKNSKTKTLFFTWWHLPLYMSGLWEANRGPILRSSVHISVLIISVKRRRHINKLFAPSGSF